MRVLRHVNEVGAEHHVRAAADAPAVHLSNDRLAGLPQGHEGSHVLRHAPEVHDWVPATSALFRCQLRFRRGLEVIAGAEGAAGTAQDDDPHVGLAVRSLHSVFQARDERSVDGIEALRAVQRNER